MSLTENEQRLWRRIDGVRGEHGVPKAIASALTPFSFWVVIASIVIFLPLALFVSFFVRRHALLVQGGEVLVLDLSFWRYDVQGLRTSVALGEADLTLDGNKFQLNGETYHLEPGWHDSAARILELNSAASEAANPPG
jgi:hypothetical protein